jgi:hypothetical protein
MAFDFQLWPGWYKHACATYDVPRQGLEYYLSDDGRLFTIDICFRAHRDAGVSKDLHIPVQAEAE